MNMEGECILRYEAVQEETAKTAAEEQLRMTGVLVAEEVEERA